MAAEAKEPVSIDSEPHIKDEAPLLSMLPSSQSLSVEEVKVQLEGMVVSLSQGLNIQPEMVEHMLRRRHWNADLFLESFFDTYGTLIFESGLAPEGASKIPSRQPVLKKSTLDCPVCLIPKERAQFTALWCNHFCCTSCWKRHVESKIEIDQLLNLSCPMQNCNAAPTRIFLNNLFGKGSEAMEKVMFHLVHT